MRVASAVVASPFGMRRRVRSIGAWAALVMLTLSFGLAATDSGAAGSPQFNYILHCQGCHLADGQATPGKIPPLVGAGKFLVVEGGREFLVRVPGVSLSIIPDDELAELMNWMLYRFSAEDMPAEFEPYTAEEVGRYRQEPLVEVETVRAGLLGDYEETRDAGAAP